MKREVGALKLGFDKMVPRSKLFLLGRAFARLAAQKRRLCRDASVKEKIDKETLRLGSTVEKRLNEQNIKIARLKTRKDLLEQQLNTEIKKYKMNEETQASRIRLEGNFMLFKCVKYGVAVFVFGLGIIGGKIYEM